MGWRAYFLIGWLIGGAALVIPALFGIIARRRRRHPGDVSCNTTAQDQPTNDGPGRDKAAPKKGN